MSDDTLNFKYFYEKCNFPYIVLWNGNLHKKDDARLPAPPLGLLQPTDRQVALRLRRKTTYRPISYLNVGV